MADVVRRPDADGRETFPQARASASRTRLPPGPTCAVAEEELLDDRRTSRRHQPGRDAALCLPNSWYDNPERRTEAGVPEQVRIATKPQLASWMITTAVTAGLSCRWVAGDEAYGNDQRLAVRLRQLRLGYVLVVAC
ncbi:hypothetical protein GCM10027280_05270 [Micromonospora polyrhachis]